MLVLFRAFSFFPPQNNFIKCSSSAHCLFPSISHLNRDNGVKSKLQIRLFPPHLHNMCLFCKSTLRSLNKQILGKKSSLPKHIFLHVVSSSKASLCPFFTVENHPLRLANTELYTNHKYFSEPTMIN